MLTVEDIGEAKSEEDGEEEGDEKGNKGLTRGEE